VNYAPSWALSCPVPGTGGQNWRRITRHATRVNGIIGYFLSKLDVYPARANVRPMMIVDSPQIQSIGDMGKEPADRARARMAPKARPSPPTELPTGARF